jgi:hypothetical protein
MQIAGCHCQEQRGMPDMPIVALFLHPRALCGLGTVPRMGGRRLQPAGWRTTQCGRPLLIISIGSGQPDQAPGSVSSIREDWKEKTEQNEFHNCLETCCVE